MFVCVVCASGEKEEGGQVGGSVGQKGKAKMGKGRRVFGLLQALPLLPIEAGINTALQWWVPLSVCVSVCVCERERAFRKIFSSYWEVGCLRLLFFPPWKKGTCCRMNLSGLLSPSRHIVVTTSHRCFDLFTPTTPHNTTHSNSNSKRGFPHFLFPFFLAFAVQQQQIRSSLRVCMCAISDTSHFSCFVLLVFFFLIHAMEWLGPFLFFVIRFDFRRFFFKYFKRRVAARRCEKKWALIASKKKKYFTISASKWRRRCWLMVATAGSSVIVTRRQRQRATRRQLLGGARKGTARIAARITTETKDHRGLAADSAPLRHPPPPPPTVNNNNSSSSSKCRHQQERRERESDGVQRLVIGSFCWWLHRSFYLHRSVHAVPVGEPIDADRLANSRRSSSSSTCPTYRRTHWALVDWLKAKSAEKIPDSSSSSPTTILTSSSKMRKAPALIVSWLR